MCILCWTIRIVHWLFWLLNDGMGILSWFRGTFSSWWSSSMVGISTTTWTGAALSITTRPGMLCGTLGQFCKGCHCSILSCLDSMPLRSLPGSSFSTRKESSTGAVNFHFCHCRLKTKLKKKKKKKKKKNVKKEKKKKKKKKKKKIKKTKKKKKKKKKKGNNTNNNNRTKQSDQRP